MNKLVHEYNNSYHHSSGKKPIHANYSALTKEIDTNPKEFNLKLRLLSINIHLAKVTLTIKKYFYWFCVENKSLDDHN